MVVFSLTIVRHGETLYNRKKIMQGQTDIPLSQYGLQQAKMAASRLENESFTHVFTSDLSRASQTAQVIMDGNKGCPCTIVKDKRLRERKFGTLEGKSHKDLIAAAKKANTVVGNYTPPGAENNQQTQERAMSFFHDLCKILVAFVNESDDGDYIPGSVKQRHGGSLGRNSGHIKNCMLSNRRSQSFCGISSINDSANLDIYGDCMSSDQKKRKYDVEDHGFHKLMHKQSESDHSTEVKTSTKLNGSQYHKESRNYLEDSLCLTENAIGRSNSSSSSGYASLPDNSDLSEKDLEPSKDTESSTDSLFSSCLPGVVGKPTNGGFCPNVSLSPLLAHRLSSVSSISSGRNSSFDDVDVLPPSVADVLVVSHGGLIKELIKHFVENLGCKIPGGKQNGLKVCANCSLSKFVFTVHDLNESPSVNCLVINDKEHLNDMDIVDFDVAL